MAAQDNPDSATIYALSSGRPPSGVAVVRLSGPQASAALQALSGTPLPPPRSASLCALRDPDTGELIDRALTLWFPAPASFTGEDVVELQLHGGVAVISGVLEALARLPGLEPAEPGAFTRRAFDNGKLDLTRVEGLADLIAAETPAQRRQALRQMGGGLENLYDGWRDRLVRLLAHTEADIDFSEEEVDVAAGLPTKDAGQVATLARELTDHLADNRRGERLREGLTVAVIGPPNAGKSTFVNMLAKRDVAIVSAIPGTTRDLIEVPLNLGGYPVTLIDTAGLRVASDEIEQAGVARARARAAQADLQIGLLPLADALAGAEVDWPAATEGDKAPARLLLRSMSDLAEPAAADGATDSGGVPTLTCSVRTGQGIEAVLGWLSTWAGQELAVGEAPLITRARHRDLLQRCRDALGDAVTADGDLVLRAEHLRAAVRALGRITGRVDVEDLLDIIFRDFCIGK